MQVNSKIILQTNFNFIVMKSINTITLIPTENKKLNQIKRYKRPLPASWLAYS